MAKDGGARRSSCGPRISGGDYISASSNQSGGGARDEPSSSSSPPPSALEALLDLELLGAPAALEDNQATAAQLRAPVGDAFGELSALSLELLALQSPHGGHQHWDDDGDDGNAGDSSAQAPDQRKLRAPEEPSPLRGTGAFFALERASDTELLASPSQHSVPFLPSPCHSADGDEYDLASPVALPDTPRTAGSFEEPSGMPPLPSASVTDTQTTAVSRWESAPDLRHEVDDYVESGSLPPAPPHLQQPQQLQPPASIPKQKVKHGGIYSLLLKNRGAGDHEPVLVDEKRSPEAPEVSPDRVSSTTSARYTAKCLIEFALLHYPMLEYRPSKAAAAASAVYLARFMTCETKPWTPTLHHYSTYNAWDLQICVLGLYQLHKEESAVVSTRYGKAKEVSKKYSSEEFHGASAIPSTDEEMLTASFSEYNPRQ